MQDLKTGHLLKASPKTQFYGQILGSIWGAIISAIVYRIYDTVYTIPGKLFQVPTAYVWIDCSRLVYGQGLPQGARGFAVILGAVWAVGTVWKQGEWKWGRWVPGGVAVAVGMYNVPSFTLARAVGGGVQWWWERRVMGGAGGRVRGRDGNGEGGGQTGLIVVASGLILGEGVVSLGNLVMANWGVPHW